MILTNKIKYDMVNIYDSLSIDFNLYMKTQSYLLYYLRTTIENDIDLKEITDEYKT